MVSETIVTDGQGFVESTVTSTTNDLHALGPLALALDSQTRPGDSDYQILPSDRYVNTDAALTGTPTWTLPAASSVSQGWQVTVADSFGACNLTTFITVPPSGSDTINDLASALLVASPYAYVKVRSDGVSNWTIVAQFPLPLLQTVVGDTNYQMLPTDSYVVTSATLTAPRTWTLPAASSVSAGWQITVADVGGYVGEPNFLYLVPSGSDSIGSLVTATDWPPLAFIGSFGTVTFRSDNVSNWAIVDFNPIATALPSQILSLVPNGAVGQIIGSNGWVVAPTAWTFGSTTKLATIADARRYMAPGTKLAWDDSSGKYGYVASIDVPFGGADVTGVATTVATNLFTKTDHGHANGEVVWIRDGLVNTTYDAGYYGMRSPLWVVSATVDTFQLSFSFGGAAIDLTGTADTNLTISDGSCINIVPNADYPVGLAVVVNNRYSHGDPVGFPSSFSHTPTPTGYSANPTSLGTHFSINGGLCTLVIRDGANGTSNATTVTQTLPIAAKTVTNGAWVSTCRYVDNGAAITATTGIASITSGGTTIAFGVNQTATGGFTNANGKRIVSCTSVYPI